MAECDAQHMGEALPHAHQAANENADCGPHATSDTTQQRVRNGPLEPRQRGRTTQGDSDAMNAAATASHRRPLERTRPSKPPARRRRARARPAVPRARLLIERARGVRHLPARGCTAALAGLSAERLVREALCRLEACTR